MLAEHGAKARRTHRWEQELMRSIWKGAVSFGLVNVPVKVYSATQNHDIKFHQVHEADGGRIRYKRTCSECGKEVTFADIAKGYESADGRLVLLTDEDLKSLPLSSSREIDVVEFVGADEVDPLLLDKSYYLEPDAKALKPYVLLREALEQTDRMAVVKVALRQRESLAVLRVRGNVIVLQTMLWPDEIREPAFDLLDTKVELRSQEVAMAASLVDSLASEFDPSVFEDEYAAAVQTLVETKLEGGDVRELTAGDSIPTTTRRCSTCSPLCSAASTTPTAHAARAPADQEPTDSGGRLARQSAGPSGTAAKKAPAKKATATKSKQIHGKRRPPAHRRRRRRAKRQ
jgi:DNA end-binding protein Ku